MERPPRQIAELVETVGVAKARTDTGTLLVSFVYWWAYLRRPEAGSREDS